MSPGRDADEFTIVDVANREEPFTQVTLPGAARTAWFDSGVLIWVDTEGTLHAGDQIVPGEYTWARR